MKKKYICNRVSGEKKRTCITNNCTTSAIINHSEKSTENREYGAYQKSFEIKVLVLTPHITVEMQESLNNWRIGMKKIRNILREKHVRKSGRNYYHFALTENDIFAWIKNSEYKHQYESILGNLVMWF